MQQISSGKAPGSDAIPPAVYKHGGPRLTAELTTLFQEMWCQGKFPKDFKNGFHHNADNTDKTCTPATPAILPTTTTPTTTNDIPPVSTDFSCPQCARNFNSRIGLVVTCESIARRLVNQYLGLRPTVAAPASTDLTAPAHLHTAWAY
ncbi:unnamed protein product [Schistocephalus solidus]|uniref:Uncharacterized protein n=1 Tax=Schistocephalus solidus TaxID=70667 RepID=A0A183T470_SCHSO|nr:unnamed protein product [Schistocephalus solidus]